MEREEKLSTLGSGPPALQKKILIRHHDMGIPQAEIVEWPLT